MTFQNFLLMYRNSKKKNQYKDQNVISNGILKFGA